MKPEDLSTSMTSLKKKICVTVFLDELFEVVDEPNKKVFSNTTNVASKRRESASKTSFSRKLSGTLEGKLRSWSENHFLHREKIEKRIKKSRGCMPRLPVSVKNELDKLESKANENEHSDLEKPPSNSKSNINKVDPIDDGFDDWSRDYIEGNASEGEMSDNFSEFYESDEREAGFEVGTNPETGDSPVFEVKKIMEVTKLMKSREIVRKIESFEKTEMIKIDTISHLDEEDILRHSICSKELKKSFEELFRRKDSAFEESLMSVRNESEVFDWGDAEVQDPEIKSSGLNETLTCPILQDDLKFITGNKEKILCYAVQVQMATFDKIAREEARILSCLVEDFENARIAESCEEIPTEDKYYEIIFKAETGITNVLQFKYVARVPTSALQKFPTPSERKEIIREEKKILNEASPTVATDSDSTIVCTLSVEELYDEDRADIRVVRQLS